jgi:hypothetical protein
MKLTILLIKIFTLLLSFTLSSSRKKFRHKSKGPANNEACTYHWVGTECVEKDNQCDTDVNRCRILNGKECVPNGPKKCFETSICDETTNTCKDVGVQYDGNCESKKCKEDLQCETINVSLRTTESNFKSFTKHVCRFKKMRVCNEDQKRYLPHGPLDRNDNVCIDGHICRKANDVEYNQHKVTDWNLYCWPTTK